MGQLAEWKRLAWSVVVPSMILLGVGCGGVPYDDGLPLEGQGKAETRISDNSYLTEISLTGENMQYRSPCREDKVDPENAQACQKKKYPIQCDDLMDWQTCDVSATYSVVNLEDFRSAFEQLYTDEPDLWDADDCLERSVGEFGVHMDIRPIKIKACQEADGMKLGGKNIIYVSGLPGDQGAHWSATIDDEWSAAPKDLPVETLQLAVSIFWN